MNVLLVAPSYMDIYKDILVCLENDGHSVTFIPDQKFKHNPFNHFVQELKYPKGYFLKKLDQYWDSLFDTDYKTAVFDRVIVVDGLSISSRFFEILRFRNSKVKIVNYIYDKIENCYDFSHNFKFYDRVFSFDRADVEKYGLELLPIFWVPNSEVYSNKYKFFGMGAFESNRHAMYKEFDKLSRECGWNSYIKIYHSKVNNPLVYKIKQFIKRLERKDVLPLTELKTDLFTDQTISSDDFRRIIGESEIILDTNRPIQDGLTARFMWALGCGKKIITNNKSVKKYSFYSPEQIFVYGEDSDISSFVNTPLSVSAQQRQIVDSYKIDNWISTLFE